MTCWVACRSWRQASLSHELWRAWIWGSVWWVRLQISSLMRWILPFVVLRSALCQGKLPALWSFTYWFSFAIVSSQLVLSIFIFLNHFLWTCRPKLCWRTNTKPNTLLVRMPSCHFWCLAVNRCPKSDLQMLMRRNSFPNYLSVLFLRAGEMGIVMENGVGLGSKMGVLWWSRFGLCINCAHLH